jgi:hypothetical protein
MSTFLQLLILVLVLAIVVPVATALLLDKRLVNKALQAAYARLTHRPEPVEDIELTVCNMFQAVGCEVKVMTSLHDADNTDHELVVGVEFQGGHFICVTDASDESDCELTISFMHCLTAKADRVRELQEAVNSVNCFVNPCKCTYNVDDEDGELAVSIHSTGMRIGTDKDNIARLRSLMICCFQMHRTCRSEWQPPGWHDAAAHYLWTHLRTYGGDSEQRH